MLKDSKKPAEDLLAEENYSEELISQSEINGTIDENEVRIAKDIHSFLNSSGQSLSKSDKEQTKNRIRYSIRKLSRKRLIIRWSVAASILLCALFTSIGYFRIKSTTDIISYAQTLNHAKVGNNTQLILRNGEVVEIGTKQSQIRYDTKGEHIVIDADQKVIQKEAGTKAVFNTILVPYGKRAQITLSEGTKVWLNSGSKMIYPAVFSEHKREIYIEGEAVFNVVHMDDIPFIVSTKDFDVKDIGTIFNVCAYSDDKYSSAILEQGKVELLYHGTAGFSHEKLDISPGTMAVFDRNQRTFKRTQVNPQKYLSWREGYLLLESEKLENILIKLGRYYNIEMVITDNQLKNEKFSGLLDLKNSPEEVLAVINETTSLSFSVCEKRIFINPK